MLLKEDCLHHKFFKGNCFLSTCCNEMGSDWRVDTSYRRILGENTGLNWGVAFSWVSVIYSDLFLGWLGVTELNLIISKWDNEESLCLFLAWRVAFLLLWLYVILFTTYRNSSTKELTLFAAEAIALNRQLSQHENHLSEEEESIAQAVCSMKLSPPSKSRLAKRRAMSQATKNTEFQPDTPAALWYSFSSHQHWGVWGRGASTFFKKDSGFISVKTL